MFSIRRTIPVGETKQIVHSALSSLNLNLLQAAPETTNKRTRRTRVLVNKVLDNLQDKSHNFNHNRKIELILKSFFLP